MLPVVSPHGDKNIIAEVLHYVCKLACKLVAPRETPCNNQSSFFDDFFYDEIVDKKFITILNFDFYTVLHSVTRGVTSYLG